MSDLLIASLHSYSSRFLRSTDLVRDFDDPRGLNGYWLTDFGQSCLDRLSDSFRLDSGRRTWRLTGDFGTGKSSFALLLARTASNAHLLPKNLLRKVLEEIPTAKDLRYVPVLVTATRERIATAILRAIFKAFGSLYSRRGSKSSLETEIADLLSDPARITDNQVLNLIEQTNRKIIRDGRGSGMLLILDEVGKFLEFAAHNPDEQDIYFLQRLAELADRSGNEPVIVICLLHQGFNAYAEQLAPSSQREWEKIAGRFEEIVFRQPLDQVALLIASALNLDEQKLPPSLKKNAICAFNAGVERGWFGTSASRELLGSLVHKLFPLDPLLLPVLIRVFQRFGQNERSLFSFLCSHEPFGFRAFTNNLLSRASGFYDLAEFYDYVRATFGHRLGTLSYRNHWGVIESKIEAHPADNELEVRILKTVGVLNLLNADDLRPTREIICWAVGGNFEAARQQVAQTLKKLEGRDIHFRGEVRGYSIWPYTSVDIDARLEEAKTAIPRVTKIADAIRRQLDGRPVVARAHYIKTGNLRYFDVVYCEPHDLEEKASEQLPTLADGVIVVPLCETKREADAALSAAQQIKGRDDLVQLIAVPRPLYYLQQAALDALRWEWVQDTTKELNNDTYARDEVQLHLTEARNRLQSQIQEFIGLNRIGGRITLTWFYKGKRFGHTTGRQVMRWLSDLCRDEFRSAPMIRNELVNRQALSSAAAAARMRLIELMFTSSDKPALGLPVDRKPPEKSMYLSVLSATGIHDEQEGHWQLGYPVEGKFGNVRPILERFRKIVLERPDARIRVSDLLVLLKKPPFGVRSGLFYVLLAVFAIVEEREVAFYENGSFLREVDAGIFLRMTKAPERFDMQYCKIDGVRSDIFQRLLTVLDVKTSDGSNTELLDIVKNLCVFVARLPDYVLNTHKLSAIAVGVRDSILNAREPGKLLFSDLPKACGFEAITVSLATGPEVGPAFVKILKSALDELRAAYLEMQDRLRLQLRNAFQMPGSFQQFRSGVAIRAERILAGIIEPKLRAFCLRLFDDNLPEIDWLESVGSFLALKPPSKWRDTEEELFISELAACTKRFLRVESIVFTTGKSRGNAIGIRLSVTQANGDEHEQVVHYNSDEEQELQNLQRQFEQMLVKEGRLGLAAASRAILASYKGKDKVTHE